MQNSDIFIDYPYELFSYMREIRKPVFHNSNVFLRDVQYSIQDYFEDKQGVTIRSAEAEKIAEEVARAYERKGIFRRVNPQGYMLNFPELITGKSGTKGGLSGEAEQPMPPQKMAAPVATAPKAAAPKPTEASKPAATGAVPAAGAKAPPPWLKK